MASVFDIKHIEMGSLSLTNILVGMLLAPIYEEIIFRLCLVFNRKNYFVSLTIISVLVIFLIFNQKYTTAVVFGVVLLLLLVLAVFDFLKIKYFIDKYFKYFFWFSVISFGLVHISNFKGDALILFILFPLFCFPQLIMGAILGYVRMQYGFLYSVFIHLTINSLLLLKFVTQ